MQPTQVLSILGGVAFVLGVCAAVSRSMLHLRRLQRKLIKLIALADITSDDPEVGPTGPHTIHYHSPCICPHVSSVHCADDVHHCVWRRWPI